MIAEGKSIGKWTNTVCDKKSVVMCQKMQNWTGGRLQKEFLDMKKLYGNQIATLKNTIFTLTNDITKNRNDINQLKNNFNIVNTTLQNDSAKSKEEIKKSVNSIANLQNNPVPINFIYAQLPNQPEAAALWPNVKRQEVTT